MNLLLSLRRGRNQHDPEKRRRKEIFYFFSGGKERKSVRIRKEKYANNSTLDQMKVDYECAKIEIEFKFAQKKRVVSIKDPQKRKKKSFKIFFQKIRIVT